jgi:Ammonium Transporter Family
VPIYALGGDRDRRRVVCYYTIQLKNRLHWDWDDALDVWGAHGMGGLLRIVLLGVFAGTAINPTGPGTGARLSDLLRSSSPSRSPPASAARPTRSASPT